MREVINISLPKAMADQVKVAMREERFATKSEFFRHLIRRWEEERLVRDVAESEREFAAGKGRVLRSFQDLR